MTLPQGLQDAKARNDLYWASVAQANGTASVDVVDVVAPTEAVQPITQEVAANDVITEQVFQPQGQPQGQPMPFQPQAQTVVFQPQAQTIPQPQENTDWEAKFRNQQTISGKQMRDAQAENQALLAKNNNLEGLLSEIGSQPGQAAPVDVQSFEITTDDVDEYGDTLDMMMKVTRKEIAPLQAQIATMQAALNQININVVPKMAQVEAQQADTGSKLFYDELTSLVPQWRVINDDERFKDWLREVDHLTGLDRQVFLVEAHRNRDAVRVAGFFNTWNNSDGVAITQADPNFFQQPTARPATELELQIAPNTSRAPGVATAVANTALPIYTRDDISRFYAGVRKGAYSPADKKRIETDIYLAQEQGRLVK